MANFTCIAIFMGAGQQYVKTKCAGRARPCSDRMMSRTLDSEEGANI
jgi:hypothetical protein